MTRNVDEMVRRITTKRFHLAMRDPEVRDIMDKLYVALRRVDSEETERERAGTNAEIFDDHLRLATIRQLDLRKKYDGLPLVFGFYRPKRRKAASENSIRRLMALPHSECQRFVWKVVTTFEAPETETPNIGVSGARTNPFDCIHETEQFIEWESQSDADDRYDKVDRIMTKRSADEFLKRMKSWDIPVNVECVHNVIYYEYAAGPTNELEENWLQSQIVSCCLQHHANFVPLGRNNGISWGICYRAGTHAQMREAHRAYYY